MKNETKKLLQEYKVQVIVEDEQVYEKAQCCDDGALNNLCCLLNCLSCCNTASEAAAATTTTTPTYTPPVRADFTNTIESGAEQVSLLEGYNRSTGLFTFHLYSTYMRISTWNSESKIRCLYKIDYSNIKSISANKPSSSEGEYRFFFTINFHRTVNYYVNDHYIGDANKTFFICNCYGDLTYSSAMDRYTENFVNQIYRKLNMFCGYEHYKLVNFTGTTQISSPVKPNNKTTNYVQKSTVVEEPNEKPISPVENQAGFTYDYDEDDGYDYGDDE